MSPDPQTFTHAKPSAIERRSRCSRCWQPRFACFCADFKPQSLPFQLLILIHPIERKRRLASGRLLHALIENSICYEGEEFIDHPGLQRLLSDTRLMPFVLSPGPGSVDLDRLDLQARRSLLMPMPPDDRRLLLILIDGTWATARRMLRSPQLTSLPRLMFSPQQSSRFIVRQQPAPNCLSTLEATAEFIERFALDPESRPDGEFLQAPTVARGLRLAFAKLIREHLDRDPSGTYAPNLQLAEEFEQV
jgi:DTW domain-containing protein YfiP